MGDRSIAILYGSETGNSEDIAMELDHMVRRLHFNSDVSEMNGFKLKDILQFSLVIFVTSTTGQGEVPANATKFWRNLRRQTLTGTNCLASVRFTIFGLGDSSYPKFNWAARKLRGRLLQLGASEFFRAGEGDERHDDGIDSTYLPWYQHLRSTLLAEHPLPESVEPIPDDVRLPSRHILRLAVTKMDTSRPDDEKAAVFTHKERPRTLTEHNLDFFYGDRLVDPSIPVIARKDETWEDTTGKRVDFLDKDNIITDYPEEYDLEPADPTKGSSPELLLPIPNTFAVTMLKNQRVTPEDHWQDVRLLAFRLVPHKIDEDKMPEIGPGSTIILYPKNLPEDVQTLINLMNWTTKADRMVEWKELSAQSAPIFQSASILHAHRPAFRSPKIYHPDEYPTLRSLLTHNFDITAIPKRNFLSQLQHHTEDPREKERLSELVRNAEEFYDYVPRPRRTIIEVLQDFPGVKIPMEDVISMFPLIRGREYSIANGFTGQTKSGVQGAWNFEVLAALVEYKTVIRKPRTGLCSRYLKHLRPGTDMQVGFNKVGSLTRTGAIDCSQMVEALQVDEDTARRPVIAVATGTGISPFRYVLQDRFSAIRRGHRMGPVLLFYGCRSEHADFHFGEEWRFYESHGEIELHAAFSRDPVPADSALAKDLDPYVERPSRYPHVSVTGSDRSSIYKPDPIFSHTDRDGQAVYKRAPAVLPPIDSLSSDLSVFDYDRGRNYVQHHIRRHAKRVAELLQQNPLVMVCGGAGRMPISVWAALRDALVLGDVVETRKQAEAWLQDEKNLTFWQETW